jgi:hypothetical protein
MEEVAERLTKSGRIFIVECFLGELLQFLCEYTDADALPTCVFYVCAHIYCKRIGKNVSSA